MARILHWTFAIALSVGAAACAGAARASDDDDLKVLVSDCSGPDLQFDDVKPCLERARVLDESRPSPALQRLMMQLERRLEDGEDAPASSKTTAEPATGNPRTLSTPAAAGNGPSGGQLGSALPSYSQAEEPGAEREAVSNDLEASRMGDSDGGAPREIEVDDPAAPAEPGSGPHS